MQHAKINKAIEQIIKDSQINILKSISNDYGISYDELYNKYINNYIEMHEIIYDKKKYLADNDKNIYSYNLNNPKFLGKKLIDGTINFIKTK